MAKNQTRRSVSISAIAYEKLQRLSKGRKESMSSIIEGYISKSYETFLFPPIEKKPVKTALGEVGEQLLQMKETLGFIGDKGGE